MAMSLNSSVIKHHLLVEVTPPTLLLHTVYVTPFTAITRTPVNPAIKEATAPNVCNYYLQLAYHKHHSIN